MPIMSPFERGLCANPIWDAITERVVVPRVFAGVDPGREVLELGSGAGSNAVALLKRYDAIHMTLTDVDPVMRQRAARRVEPFGDRAEVVEADATDLDFEDASFDVVVSMLMLHHVIAWTDTVTEIARVLRPGGMFVGYDLTDSPSARVFHLPDRSEIRLVGSYELRDALEASGFAQVSVGRLPLIPLMRFRSVRSR